MSSKKRNNLILAALAALGAIAILVYAGAATDHSKKHDRPMSPQTPVASMAPSAGALKADKPYPPIKCGDLVDIHSLEALTNRDLKLTVYGSNSGARENYDFLCDYDRTDTNRLPVAQTSYAVLDAHGLGAYRTELAGKDDALATRRIPASRLPAGTHDGFEFTPRATSADNSSIYNNPGARLRIGDQVVAISFEGFDRLTANLKRDWEYTVVRNVLATQK